VKDFEVIMGDLASFGAGLQEKPMIVAASKVDAANKEKLTRLKRYCTRKKLTLYPISAVSGEGIEKLKWAMAKKLEEPREEQATGVQEPAAESR
jgi:GTP-binding protein